MNNGKRIGSTALTAVALAALLSACGGGGGSSSNSDNSSPAPAPAPSVSPTNSSGLNALFLGNQFDVYAPGASAPTANAGVIDRSNTQGLGWQLGGSASTVLNVLGTDFGISASGFTSVNRGNGSVIMLCSGNPLKSVHVGVVTQAGTGGTQASKLSRAADLAGQTFYLMEDCSYTDNNGNSSNQNAAPTANTVKFSFDASGNFSSSDGSSATAAEINGLLTGGSLPIEAGAGKLYLTAYTFTVNGVSRYVLVSRGVPNSGNGGFVALWLQN